MEVQADEPRLDTGGTETLSRTPRAPHHIAPMVAHGGQPSSSPPRGVEGTIGVAVQCQKSCNTQ